MIYQDGEDDETVATPEETPAAEASDEEAPAE
jgi:hypothetical protein